MRFLTFLTLLSLVFSKTFITAPCNTDDDCLLGCCGFVSGTCSGPVVAVQERGGCGHNSPLGPNSNAAALLFGFISNTIPITNQTILEILHITQHLESQPSTTFTPQITPVITTDSGVPTGTAAIQDVVTITTSVSPSATCRVKEEIIIEIIEKIGCKI